MIAPEGRLIISLLCLCIVALHLAVGVIVWPLWGIVLVLSYLYRDPKRTIPSAPLGLVSPVDGVIIAIENKYDTFLKREAFVISIQMNWSGAYVLRAVTEGKIMQHWLHEAGTESQELLQHAIWIQTDELDDVVIAIHAAGRFRRMHCYASVGERVGQGKRCGFIPFGTRVDVILPVKTRTALKPGDKVLAGRDLIAQFVH
ncbi:MAG: phosphatidylserine decarboxylase [Thioalkalispiraceae bacterium]|jgi:phosphatidylserine decarboxylase